MITRILRLGLVFVILLLLQVLLFNNIKFSGYVNPFIYILFILLLPVKMPTWILLITAFFTGLIVDFFSGSAGMHASATVLAGYARSHVLSVISPRDGYDPVQEPSLSVYGFRWFLIYTLIIVLIHHFALFYLEVFRLAGFFRTFLRVFLSSMFSTAFILVIEYFRKGK
jgi:rod shape-determining protein MreD